MVLAPLSPSCRSSQTATYFPKLQQSQTWLKSQGACYTQDPRDLWGHDGTLRLHWEHRMWTPTACILGHTAMGHPINPRWSQQRCAREGTWPYQVHSNKRNAHQTSQFSAFHLQSMRSSAGGCTDCRRDTYQWVSTSHDRRTESKVYAQNCGGETIAGLQRAVSCHQARSPRPLTSSLFYSCLWQAQLRLSQPSAVRSEIWMQATETHISGLKFGWKPHKHKATNIQILTHPCTGRI